MGSVYEIGLSAVADENTGAPFDNTPYLLAMYLLAASAAFGIGTEFAEGTVRSKLVMGFTKRQIFLAELISTIIEAVIVFGFVTAGVFIMGYKNYLELFSGGILLRSFGLMLGAFIVTAAVYTTVCCLIHNRAAAMLLCALICFGMFMLSDETRQSLTQPEYRIVAYGESSDEGDRIADERKEENVHYASGAARRLLTAGYYLAPPSSLYISEKLLDRFEGKFTVDDLEQYREDFKDSKETWDYDFMCGSRIDLWKYPLWGLGEFAFLTVLGMLIIKKRNIQ